MPDPRPPYWRRKRVWMIAAPVLCVLAVYYVVIPGMVAGRLRAALAPHGAFLVAVGSVTTNFHDTVTLHNLTLANAAGTRLFYAPMVRVACAGNPLTDAAVPVTGLRLVNATWLLSRKGSGVWNWQQALANGRLPGTPSDGAVPGAWIWPAEIALENCRVTVETRDENDDAMRLETHDVTGALKWRDDRYELADVAGVCCGGVLKMSGFIRPGDGVHDVQCSLRNAMVQDLFKDSPEKKKKISGDCEADFRLIREDAASSRRLQGQARLRNAMLWELEFFETTMRVIRLGGVKLTTFDEATIDFVQTGDRLEIPESRFTSDAVSFFGFGSVEAGGELNMHLVPRFGAGATVSDIPVIGGILQSALNDVKSDAFQVNVTGTLFKPKTRVSPRGGVEEFSKSLVDKIADFLK